MQPPRPGNHHPVAHLSVPNWVYGILLTVILAGELSLLPFGACSTTFRRDQDRLRAHRAKAHGAAGHSHLAQHVLSDGLYLADLLFDSLL